jgi:hypothetical protein
MASCTLGPHAASSTASVLHGEGSSIRSQWVASVAVPLGETPCERASREQKADAIQSSSTKQVRNSGPVRMNGDDAGVL